MPIIALPVSDHANVTMVMQLISASQFKAQCLALLDDVALTGEEIVVTKRGRPVARLVAIASRTARRAP